MKDFRFICVQPDDDYYTWQVHAWIESLKTLGYSEKATVLIFIPQFRNKNPKLQQIIDLYPETEFVFYKDVKGEVNNYFQVYIPALRPWTLAKYFEEHPEWSEKAVFYCDSDVVFTDKLDVEKFVNDDVCYLSDTNSYINASYFDSKVKDVIPQKMDDYNTRDILGETASIVGINRATCEKYNEHSGGAQYLLKNINSEFWKKVFKDCIAIRMQLMFINKQYFPNENKGFQSWCADMWAVLWNLWLRNQETKCVPEMDFSWASDGIEKLSSKAIFHNAGIVSENGNGYPAFYKGKYHNGGDPTKDPHLEIVLNDENSKKYCTHFYATKLKELKQKYNLNY